MNDSYDEDRLCFHEINYFLFFNISLQKDVWEMDIANGILRQKYSGTESKVSIPNSVTSYHRWGVGFQGLYIASKMWNPNFRDHSYGWSFLRVHIASSLEDIILHHPNITVRKQIPPIFSRREGWRVIIRYPSVKALDWSTFYRSSLSW